MNILPVNHHAVIYVGLDVHKDSISMAVLRGYEQSFFVEKRFATKNLAKLRKFLNKLAAHGRVICCYEASGAGFYLRRQIDDWGYQCEIAASSLIPTKPGERKKCDRLDAQKLATYLRSGLLTFVNVPSAEEEAARGLVRCRRAVRKDVTTWKHRVGKFLATKGVVYRDGENWTGKHRTWLERVKLPLAADMEVLRFKLETLAYLERRLKEIDTRIEALSHEEPFRLPVRFLRGFRGIETLTAMVVVTEIGDIRRFPGPRKLMAYTGLVPALDQSGGGDNKAKSITKMGNSYLRHILVQAAWNYTRKPGRSAALRKRQEGVPAWLIEMSDKAQQRLYARFHHLARTRDRNVAVVAVARELVGFIGAALYQMTAEAQAA